MDHFCVPQFWYHDEGKGMAKDQTDRRIREVTTYRAMTNGDGGPRERCAWSRTRVTAIGRQNWHRTYTRRNDGRRWAMWISVYPALSLKSARSKAKGYQAEIESDKVRASLSHRPAGPKAIDRPFGKLADNRLEKDIPRKTRVFLAVPGGVSMLDRHVRQRIGAIRQNRRDHERDIIRMLGVVARRPDLTKGGSRTGRDDTSSQSRL